ncbi:FG-GAP-like repeat-containing protein [Actinomadura hibisca]|uniref:FG-GAP-like repeat-containing protein n=1 Tax=Actinomadura hibisca TaxID=68565 RepID=UPI00082F5267|nr:FG-GAP-like repeat-containing protein [Actinomadura hibisca]
MGRGRNALLRAPFVGALVTAIMATLLAALPAPAWADPPTAPAPPHAVQLPPDPIKAGDRVGYLNSTSGVGPSGDYTRTVPLEVPMGRAGMQPSLSLRYSSGAGDGPFGTGWSLSGLSAVTRCAETLATEGTVAGVRFTNKDRFCLDGQKLVAVSGGYGESGTEYRTETDTVLKIVQEGLKPEGPGVFKVHSRDGRVSEYLAWSAPRTTSTLDYWAASDDPQTKTAPAGAPRVVWLLTKVRDRSGNEVRYEYQSVGGQEDFEVLPHRVKYTFGPAGGFAEARRFVEFETEARPDPTHRWQNGVRFASTRRVKAIKMFAPNPGSTQLAWQYDLDYKKSATSGRSLLAKVARCAMGSCLWAKEFDWSQPPAAPSFKAMNVSHIKVDSGLPAPAGWPEAPLVPAMHVADLDGDGRDDMFYYRGGWDKVGQEPNNRAFVRFSASGAPLGLLRDDVWKATAPAEPRWPSNISVSLARPVDYDNDGKSEVWAPVQWYDDDGDLVTHHRFELLKWDSVADRFVRTGIVGKECAGVEKVSSGATPCVPSDWADLNGDGRPDLIQGSQAKGILEAGWNTDFDYGSYEIRMNEGSSAPFSPLGPTIGSTVAAGCSTRITDLNGDGRAELLTGERKVVEADLKCVESGWSMGLDPGAATATATPQRVAAGSSENRFLTANQFLPAVKSGDFNGDGLEDTVFGQDGHIAWNTGNGTRHQSGSGVGECLKNCRLADMNGDGRTDIVKFGATAGDGTSIWVHLSKGDGTFTEVKIDGGDHLNVPGFGRTMSGVGDFNGDGRKDLVTVTATGQLRVFEQKAELADLLTGVRDQETAWPREEVEYSTSWEADPSAKPVHLCGYPLTCLRKGLTVVRKTTSRAHFVNPAVLSAGARVTHYSYDDPVADLRGRGFLGFAKVVAWDPDQATETVTAYSHRSTTANGKYHPHTAVPASVTVKTPILTQAQLEAKPVTATARISRSVVHETEVRQSNNGSTYMVLPKKSYTKEWEQQVNLTWNDAFSAQNTLDEHVWNVAEPANASRRTDLHVTYDAFGNVASRYSAVEGGVKEWTNLAYENRTADWLIGLPVTQTVTRAEPDNDPGPVTRRVDHSYNAAGLLETTEFERTNPDLRQRRAVTYGYDTLGVLTTVTDAAPETQLQRRHIEYTPLYPQAPDERIFASQVWTERDAAYVPSTWTAVHPAYGVPVVGMDVNGVQDVATYDGFGRVTSMQRQGDQKKSFEYTGRADAFGGANGLEVILTAGSAEGRVTSDGLGNVLSSRLPGSGGGAVTTRATYDRLGRVRSRTRPDGVQGQLVYSYDTLNRPLQIKLPGGGDVTAQYSMFEKRIWDPLGNESRLTTDKNGRVTSRVDVLKRPGQPDQPLTTGYQWEPFDLLDKVTTPQGSVTDYTYDRLGRPVGENHPDRGATTVEYDGLGQTVKRTRGPLAEIFAYDDIGRLTSSKAAGATSVFTWDTAANGKGQLASAQGPDGLATGYRYDSLGRRTGQDLSEGQNTHSVDYGYDADGRVKTVAYPQVPGRARFTAEFTRNAWQQVSKVADVSDPQNPTPLLEITGRNADMAVTDATLAGGIDLHNTYDGPTGLLTGQKASRNGADLSETDYTFWDNGLVRSRTTDDGETLRKETFDYDSLGRLTTWNLGAGEPGGPAPAPVPTTYAYSADGNLTGVSRAGNPVEHRTYGKADGGQPHTLTRITALPSHATTDYGYDQQGRNTSRTGAVARTIDFTSFDLPKTVTLGSNTWTVLHDALGRRGKKSRPGASTLYVGNLYEKRVNGSKTEHVFKVAGSQIVFDEQAKTTKVLHSLTDALGSTGQVVSADGSVDKRHYYDPFGQRVNADGGAFTGGVGAVHNGFTGHEHDDDLGLINMRGRSYDPAMKRFLSADPVVSELNGQNWNAYSYVNNSPLNSTDPSGFNPDPCADPGAGCIDVIAVSPPREGQPSVAYWVNQVVNGSPWGGPIGPGHSDADGAVGPSFCQVGCHLGNNAYSGRVMASMGDDYGREFVDVLAHDIIVPLVCGFQCGAANAPQNEDQARNAEKSLSDTQHLVNAIAIGFTWAPFPKVRMAPVGSADDLLGLAGAYRSPTARATGADVVADTAAQRVLPNGKTIWVVPGGTGKAFAGHGFDPSFTFQVPKGTSVTSPRAGARISDDVGRALERGDHGYLTEVLEHGGPHADQLEGMATHLEDSYMPDYILIPPDHQLIIMADSVTVDSPTPLSWLIQEGTGNHVWAACTAGKTCKP